MQNADPQAIMAKPANRAAATKPMPKTSPARNTAPAPLELPPNVPKLPPVEDEVAAEVDVVDVALTRSGAWAPHGLFFWQALAHWLFWPQACTHCTTYCWHSWKGMGMEYWVALGVVPSLQTQVQASVL